MDYFSNNQPRTVEIEKVLELTETEIKVTLCRSWLVNGLQNPVYVDITGFPLRVWSGYTQCTVEKSEYVTGVGSVYTMSHFREAPFTNEMIKPGVLFHIMPKGNHMFRQLKLVIVDEKV